MGYLFFFKENSKFNKLLLHDSAGPNTRKKIEIIQRCGGKLFALINDILYFARIEHDRLEFHREIFFIRELISKVVKNNSRMKDRFKIDFKVHIDQDVPQCIIGDKFCITMVMDILLPDNMSFNNIEKIHERISIDTDTLVIQIEFTKNWISPAQLEYLNLPFESEHDLPPWVVDYNGYRLMIFKKLIQQMKGRISVQCVQEEKTVFTIRLPLQGENSK